LLHIGGKAAHLDRNGTRSIIEMLEHSTADYKMVIRTQSKLDLNTKDPRLSIEFDNVEKRQDMYSEFDAMVLPRRYAGLCLPMNEALMSGLPVFMTDISPNNKVLPKEWLASATKNSDFMARTKIDVYEVDSKELAKVVDDYVNNKNKIDLKLKAFEIAHNNYSVDNLYNKYIDVLTK
jgi:glycosyltransferase involved in cell wall biosynthesis